MSMNVSELYKCLGKVPTGDQPVEVLLPNGTTRMHVDYVMSKQTHTADGKTQIVNTIVLKLISPEKT